MGEGLTDRRHKGMVDACVATHHLLVQRSVTNEGADISIWSALIGIKARSVRSALIEIKAACSLVPRCSLVPALLRVGTSEGLGTGLSCMVL